MIQDSMCLADYLASCLADKGIDRIFGHPGGEIIDLIEVFQRKGIEFVLTRHEATAGFMASLYGQAKNAPGVAMATLGPGACNLALPLANAWLDRYPLLAITARIPDCFPRDYTHQHLPLSQWYSSITKHAFDVTPHNASWVIPLALESVITHPQGAVYVTVSVTDVHLKIGAERTISFHSSDVHYEERREDVQEAIRRVSEAKRPIFLLGLGAAPRASELPEALIHAAESLEVPVFVVPKMRGIFPESHPWFGGVAGGMFADDIIRDFLKQSDLLIGLGLDPVSIDNPWYAELPLMMVQDCPYATFDSFPGSRISPLAFLKGIVDVSPPFRFQWSKEDVMQMRMTLHERLTRGKLRSSGLEDPRGLIAPLRRVIPKEVPVFTDVGSHKLLLGQFWPVEQFRTFDMSNGLSCMGYGLPAAMGRQLAEPNIPAVALVGDGGMAMMYQEIETAVRLNLDLVVIVLVDHCISLIKLQQETKGYGNIGVDFLPIDFALSAEACGARGYSVSTAEELAATVKTCLTSGGIHVVQLPIDHTGYQVVRTGRVN